MSIIGIDMGHTISGTGTGAVGCGYEEHVINRVLGKKVIDLLKREGHTIIDITVDKSANQITDRVNKANRQYLDMLVSIHFNAGRSDSKGDGSTGGVEVLTYDTKTLQPQSKAVCDKIAKLGFKNRGIKVRSDLSILARTNAKAMLIEVCFIDDKDDMNLYVKNVDNVAKAIVEGMLGITIKDEVKPPTTSPSGLYAVCVGAYNYDNAQAMKDELIKKGYKDTYLIKR